MRKFAIAAIVGASLLVSAPAVLASTPRADSYYEVWCLDGDGNLTQAESVDARAIERGHKDDAIVRFSQHYPFGLTCWPVGPFNT